MRKIIGIVICFFFIIKAQALTLTFDRGGDGVSWSDPNNWSFNTLPGANDTVMIQYDSVRLNTTATVRRIVLFNNNPFSNNSAVLVITANGILTINNGTFMIIGPTLGPNVGLRNSGTIILNNATLSNSAGYTVFNNPTGFIQGTNDSYIGISGDFRNTAGGEILMYGNINESIVCGGRLINRGTIEIRDTEDGIRIPIDGQLLNEGTLLIHDITPGYGVYLQGGTLKNKGTFDIYNTTDFGIKEVDLFTSSELLNDTTGTMNVLSGIYSYGTITNHGNMEAKAFGKPSIESFGTIYNYDSLAISLRNTYVGMRLHGPYISGSDALLYNKDIFVEPPYTFPNLIEFYDWINNQGTIEIDLYNKTRGIYFFSDSCINKGKILIKNAKYTAIEIYSKFDNQAGGSIEIDSILIETPIGSPGIGAFLLRDTLINEGLIKLDHFGEIGLYTYQGAMVQNSGNMLFSNNIGNKTVTSIEHTKGKFINDEDGKIDFVNLDNLSKVGQNFQPIIYNGSVFENYGNISFVDCQINYQILNLKLSSNDTAYFYNNGSIMESNTTCSLNSIVSSTYFINDTCGTLELVSNPDLVSPSGWMVNHGLVNFANFTGITNISLFDSDGIIVGRDKHWLGYFGNNNSLIFPISTSLKNLRNYSTGILQYGNSFTVLPIVKNSSSILQNIGTFTNNFLSINSTYPIEESIVYTFERPSGCRLTAKTIAKDFDFSCHQVRESVFIGSSDDWFLPSNWSDGFVPDYCSNVVIPAGKKVKISPQFHVTINKLLVQNGGVFDAQNASILEINNTK